MFVTMFEVILDYSSHFEIGEIFGKNEGNACSDNQLQTKSDTCIKSSNDVLSAIAAYQIQSINAAPLKTY